MKHYLQYHKIHELGRPLSSHGKFMAFTRKKVSDNYIGQTIWMISGEKQGAKTVYLLEYAFIVTTIEYDVDGCNVLRGEQGYMPSSPTPVRLAPWFIETKQRMGNFRNGLSRIPDEDIPVIAEAFGWAHYMTPTD